MSYKTHNCACAPPRADCSPMRPFPPAPRRPAAPRPQWHHRHPSLFAAPHRFSALPRASAVQKENFPKTITVPSQFHHRQPSLSVAPDQFSAFPRASAVQKENSQKPSHIHHSFPHTPDIGPVPLAQKENFPKTTTFSSHFPVPPCLPGSARPHLPLKSRRRYKKSTILSPSPFPLTPPIRESVVNLLLG